MKRLIVFLFVIGMACSCLFAVSESQYEYLVVSFGKTYFSELRSKTMAYWDQGISKTAQGATSFEKDLDILGQHGWEVVSILGAIGGDQQVTLKRLRDDARTSSELRTIDGNSEKVVNGFLESLLAEEEKAKKKEASVEIKLIELDSYEAEQAKLKKQSELETAATKFLNNLKNKPNEITVKWEAESVGKSEKLVITAKYDVTKDCLINTNQYRRSDVKRLIASYGETMETIPIPKDMLRSISLDGYITYMGKEFYTGGGMYYYIDHRGNWAKF